MTSLVRPDPHQAVDNLPRFGLFSGASDESSAGRRIKKTVSNSGDYDKTEVYFYDGQRMVQINNGSGAMVQQFIHGTQYIDELVMLRVKDKGDLYVHEDANWNVIGTTDLGRHVVERSVYTPYGELMVHQDTGFGDRDGDQDVDSTDKGTVGTTCTGTVTGAQRVKDLDFDGDYDTLPPYQLDEPIFSDEELHGALDQQLVQAPSQYQSGVEVRFAHQGLLYDPEIGSYYNRARQYNPSLRRFMQRDPVRYLSGINLYQYVASNPGRFVDPFGLDRWIVWDGPHAFLVIGPINGVCYRIELVGEGNNLYDDSGWPGIWGRIKNIIEALGRLGTLEGVISVTVYPGRPDGEPDYKTTPKDDGDLLNNVVNGWDHWNFLLYNCITFCYDWIDEHITPPPDWDDDIEHICRDPG